MTQHFGVPLNVFVFGAPTPNTASGASVGMAKRTLNVLVFGTPTPNAASSVQTWA